MNLCQQYHEASISIHALREEGDPRGHGACPQEVNFYPRPPRGGRHIGGLITVDGKLFLSTPSARRATRGQQPELCVHQISIHALREEGDPRPQKWPWNKKMSIHALREEGDCAVTLNLPNIERFLSTPSARRATKSRSPSTKPSLNFYPRPPRGGRHARQRPDQHRGFDFYPRPPRGGRQQKQRQNLYFLINYTTFCTNLEEP